MNKSEKIYQAAIYVRLSKEDGDVADAKKAESNSISNQKALIKNFLKDKEDIKIVSVREDDGYSGANFERPAFQLMMEDVKAGRVNCIVVKDLSRFGREYIDTGRYIERLFPAMGIRFIAVNDNYDSLNRNEQADEIMIPFKNLINDAYCRDISIKIRSNLEAKRKRGEFVGAFSVYGYFKSEENHNILVPDEYAGHVVQDIFRWIKNGMSLDFVSKKLNGLGILAPLEYKKSIGENYATCFKKKEIALWTPTTVRRIATNIIYTGTLVQGKQTTPNHKIKTPVRKEPEKWAVVEHNHEPLVSNRDFDIVQRLLHIDMRTSPGQDMVYMMSGIAVCADCGALMARKVSTVGGKKYVYYLCSANKKQKLCTPHRIKENVLEENVLQVLQAMIAHLLELDELVKAAGEIDYRKIDIKKMKERLQAKEEEIAKYNRLLISLYEDLKDGIIGKEDFQLIKNSFETKKSEAERAMQNIQSEQEAAINGERHDGAWVEHFRKYKNIGHLTRNVVVELIKSVKVFESGDLEIEFDFSDEYQNLVSQVNEIKRQERKVC